MDAAEAPHTASNMSQEAGMARCRIPKVVRPPPPSPYSRLWGIFGWRRRPVAGATRRNDWDGQIRPHSRREGARVQAAGKRGR